MKVKLIKLSEERINELPFPDTARKLGGILVLEEHALENHLNVEEFRRQWNETIANKTFKRIE